MRAMIFSGPGRLLRETQLARPEPGPGQVRLNVQACAVCRTDLHIVDGELADPELPLVLGHQIVSLVSGVGEGASRFSVGERVGVPWLGWTAAPVDSAGPDGRTCCDEARGSPATRSTVALRRAVRTSGTAYHSRRFTPTCRSRRLLCAGLIGYRSLVMTGDAERLGLYGFGASAHIIAQVARWQTRRVFAFTRPGDEEGQHFARSLGAEWAGSSTKRPPEELDAAIIFAPVGALVPAALAAVAKGGVVVCAGIHMSEIPAFSYDLLWGERVLRSVANLTRKDGEEFMELAPRVPVRTGIPGVSAARGERSPSAPACGRTTWRRRAQDRLTQDWTYPLFGSNLARTIQFLPNARGALRSLDWLVVGPKISNPGEGWLRILDTDDGWKLFRVSPSPD